MKQIMGGTDIIMAITDGVFMSYEDYDMEVASTPASIVAAYLNSQNIMTVPTANLPWPLYIGFLPDILKSAGAIYDTNGMLDGRIQKTGKVVEHQGVMIKICTSKYEDGWTKINAIAELLNTVNNVTIILNEIQYKIEGLRQMTPATYIGINEKRKFNFTVDYLVDISIIESGS